MKLMAIIELRGYASAVEVFDRDDGAKHVPSHWVDIIMAIREANVKADKERKGDGGS